MQSPNPYDAPTFGGRASKKNIAGSGGRKLGWPIVILVGFLIPGLVIWLIRRDQLGILMFLALFFAIPLSFVFFGPIWDLVLFSDTGYDEAGREPFLVSCAIVPCVSLVLSIITKLKTVVTLANS